MYQTALNLRLSCSSDKLNLSQVLYKSRGCELRAGGGGLGEGGLPFPFPDSLLQETKNSRLGGHELTGNEQSVRK